MKPSSAASAAASAPGTTRYRPALLVLTSLFFMWGLITSLNDILIPHLKAAFSLSYVQAMLIQFCFFGAYFVMSLPAGTLVDRLGYRRGIVIGLVVASVGCLLFLPAASAREYGWFLGALFVLASGITLLQVAANPYVTLLGPPQTAPARLTMTQAFNSLGTTVGPLLGSALILSAPTAGGVVDAVAEADSVKAPYLGLALALVLLAVLMGLARLPQLRAQEEAAASLADARAMFEGHPAWRHRHLLLGVLAIFLYVGGEVAIGSLLVNVLASPEVAGLPEQVAGRYVALYWGGAMLGRFIGAGVMARVRPGRVLAFNAGVAVLLLLLAITVQGEAAMWSLLAIGLCNSVMFPTIFALAISGLGPNTGKASGLLCMAIFGGALVPVLQGWLADTAGLLPSFVVPAACYVYIALYGAWGWRPRLW